MSWLEGTLADALHYVAQRRVQRGLEKEALLKAAEDNPALDAADARKSLGVLGAERGQVDSAVKDLRGGKIGPYRAKSRIQGAVPGRLEQALNVPSAVITAGKAGKPADALAQADVVGLKNLNPLSENFSPSSWALAPGAGLLTGVGQYAYGRHNLHQNILHGRHKEDWLAKVPGMDERQLKAWREANVPAAHPAGGPVVGAMLQEPGAAPQGAGPMGKLWHQLKSRGSAGLGALKGQYEAATAVPKGKVDLPPLPEVPAAGGSKAQPAVAGKKLEYKHLVEAARKYKTNVTSSPAGMMTNLGKTLALPALAAAAPLAIKEWGPGLGGYRSGSKPARKLVDSVGQLDQGKK